MKKLINQTRYRCDHCKKEYKIESACEKHEPRCASNPENFIACSGCTFIREVEKHIYAGYMDYDGEPSTVLRRGFFCLKKQVGMYPPLAKHRGTVDEHPETFEGEIIMPTKCDDWYWQHETDLQLPVGVREYKK